MRPRPARRRPAGAVPAAIAARPARRGHGWRLTAAFAALATFPALAESRDRLRAVSAMGHPASAEVVSAIEGDMALVMAVLRLANARQRERGSVDTVVGAIKTLSAQDLQALARSVSTFDFFEHCGVWESLPERMRLHALATKRAVDRIAVELHHDHRDRLAVASLLHDVGKVVLTRAYPGYPSEVHRGARTPSERVEQERREFGVDHALLGGALIRRWGLPGSLASAIEGHHEPDATGEAAIVRLADVLAHYEHGAHVSPGELVASANAAQLGIEQLRRVMCDLPGACSPRRHPVDPCPLSSRELGLLQRLAAGSVYKQIAHELALSVSTVRTHLHNVYRKLGVVNRAQAVLVAAQRGWI
jgi:HD-like signal output (HDOD) protein/DNA-binding CsgD family transcriptional regulator